MYIFVAAAAAAPGMGCVRPELIEEKKYIRYFLRFFVCFYFLFYRCFKISKIIFVCVYEV